MVKELNKLLLINNNSRTIKIFLPLLQLATKRVNFANVLKGPINIKACLLALSNIKVKATPLIFARTFQMMISSVYI